jgi:hypothetical protein
MLPVGRLLIVMNLSHKKLPPHWRYIIPIRRIKELVRDSNADIRSVKYSGTSNKPTDPMPWYWHAARFNSRVVSDELCFQLTFKGIPESILDMADSDLAQQTLDAIEEFLEHRFDHIDATTPPRTASITLDAQNQSLAFGYRDTKSDNRELPVIPWW